MQHLLTEDELDNLVPLQQLREKELALKVAREKILYLANYDCIHDKKGSGYKGYCDNCPLSVFQENEYSSLMKSICTLTQSYGK